MTDQIPDITIIGGGPTGLFASFYAGMRGATAQIVDALPELGGQLTALYPEKYIFDVGGFTRILAKPEFRNLDAGIVLQAYLPDALSAMARLQDWAAERRANGGAGSCER